MATKLATLVKERSLLLFGLQGQGQITGLRISIVCSICLIITNIGTVVATREWIIHCIYANLLNFAPGWNLFFSNISCCFRIRIHT